MITEEQSAWHHNTVIPFLVTALFGSQINAVTENH
jgi:hypothetical protein